jgi:hypothetical protein
LKRIERKGGTRTRNNEPLSREAISTSFVRHTLHLDD